MSQAAKQLLMLLGLLAIAGGVGAYAYFGVFQPEKEAARQKDHDLRLFAAQKLDEKQRDGGAPPAQFTRVVVTVDGETTELEREPDQPWRIVKPVRAAADLMVVDGLISQLQTAKFKEALVENPDAATFAKYGLDRPRFTVEAWAAVNGEVRSVKLLGGAENSFDGSIFVRRNDEPAIFSAPGGVRFSLAKRTFDLRDKTPFALDDRNLARLALKSRHREWELVREGARWKLGKDFTDAANTQAMFHSGGGSRVKQFFEDTAENRKRLGFDAPLYVLLATFKDGRTVKLTAAQRPDGEDFTWYGLREDDAGNVLAELGQDIAAFDKHPDDLRDQAVLQFTREHVVKAVFHNADGSEVVVEKDSVDASAESWRITAPRPAKARVFKITGALWTLGAFKPLKQHEKNPKDWSKYGIDDKARFVALYGEDGRELARLTIGKLVEGTPSAYYVRGSRDQVLESDGSRFSDLPFELETVLDEPGDAGAP